ncbi:RDD family protein [Chloroflexus sp. Y-396-1]|uniref:RDD family protein n=1 Tax=Chloroflexus sp. Y-396-1 TaxID=867845 RepID=UPI00048E06E6|nr:RDD family protein [Chloroflexus sp. Y-396-1]
MNTLQRDEQYRVLTPEGVEIIYVMAGPASRSLAALIDYLILVTILIIGATSISFSDRVMSADLALALLAIYTFVVNWSYYIFFEWFWNGQTPGKRLLRLRVLREGGRPVDIGAIVVRNLMRAIDFLPLGYGVGLLAMFVDRYHRRLGDLTAGTIVVHEGAPLTLDRVLRPVVVQVPPRAPDAPPTPLVPNVDRLTADDIALLVEFLQRRLEFDPDSRLELAAQLTMMIRQRLGLPPADGHPERFLEHVLREHEVAQAIMARHSG